MPALKFQYIREGLEGMEGRVLEIGCGDGKHFRSLEALNSGLQLYGCDVAVGVLSTAKNASKKIIFIGGDAISLPFKAESFDTVIFSDLLEHVANYREAITEVCRVLKRHGKLVCYVPVEGEAYSLFRIYFVITGVNVMESMGHINMFRKSDLVAVLAPCFCDLRLRYLYHFFGQISSFVFFCYLYYRGKPFEFFREKCCQYRSRNRIRRNFLESVVRKLVLLGNWVAYYESSFLKRTRFPAIGMHIICTKKGHFSRSPLETL